MTPIEAFRVYEDAVLRFLRGWNPEPDDYEKIDQARPILKEACRVEDVSNTISEDQISLWELMKKLP